MNDAAGGADAGGRRELPASAPHPPRFVPFHREAIEHGTRALTDGRLTVGHSLGGTHAMENPLRPCLFRANSERPSAE